MRSKLVKGSLAFILILLLFGLGAISTLIQYKGRSYISVAYDKAKEVLKIQKFDVNSAIPDVSSSRYELKFESEFKYPGVYQLTTDNSGNLYALNRNNGSLYFFEKSNLANYRLVVNIYSKLGLPVNNVGISPPLAMDLHYAFSKLFFSIVTEGADCHYLNLGYLNLTSADENTSVSSFFSSPCISDTKNSVMWGGRMTSNSDSLFVSIGEQRFDRSGFPKENLRIKNKLDQNIFGCILEFKSNLESSSIFAQGFRNAQGLFWDHENNLLFEAEHGPNGGDEVNIVTKGKNYGWPYESLGKPYEKKYPSGKDEVNLAKDPRINVDSTLKKFGSISGQHDKFTKPLFSWIPGVGAGNLVRVPSNSPLIDWRNDLIVVQMAQGTLHRLKLSGARVILDEEISIGFRVRDILIDPNGFIFLSTDSGRIIKFYTYDSYV